MLVLFIFTTLIVFLILGLIIFATASFYPEFKYDKNDYAINKNLIISSVGKEYTTDFDYWKRTKGIKVFQGNKKWFLDDKMFLNNLNELLKLFDNNEEVNFFNFKINKNNAKIEDKLIKWDYITYMSGFSFSTYEARNIFIIEFNRITKLYTIRFIDLFLGVILEVINFESQKEVEIFINNTYKFYLQEKKKQEELDKIEKIEKEKLLNSLP